MDSRKFSEYLAAGVPVVTTPFHQYINEDFDHLIDIASDVDAFLDRVENILDWNEQKWADWRRRCKVFVAQNTWSVRGAEALREIQRLASADLKQ